MGGGGRLRRRKGKKRRQLRPNYFIAVIEKLSASVFNNLGRFQRAERRLAVK